MKQSPGNGVDDRFHLIFPSRLDDATSSRVKKSSRSSTFSLLSRDGCSLRSIIPIISWSEVGLRQSDEAVHDARMRRNSERIGEALLFSVNYGPKSSP